MQTHEQKPATRTSDTNQRHEPTTQTSERNQRHETSNTQPAMGNQPCETHELAMRHKPMTQTSERNQRTKPVMRPPFLFPSCVTFRSTLCFHSPRWGSSPARLLGPPLAHLCVDGIGKKQNKDSICLFEQQQCQVQVSSHKL